MKIVCVVAIAALASPAFADPCEGALPTKAGAVFAGVVRYVGDGDSLCIGKTGKPGEWIEVRLEDFNAPELHSKQGSASKAFLERTAKGKQASCTVMRGRNSNTTSHDRVIARCTIGGVSIGDLLRKAGAPAGGN